MEFIKFFESINKHDALSAGGKGASLGEMTQAGIPVPPGFVVLSSSFERFLEETDLGVEIDAILHGVDVHMIHTVEHASETIQKLILEADMPEDIRERIRVSYTELNAEFVAVRSSATAEDSASAAWAGQLDSFLNTTEATLLQNVQRCWASLFTPRAIFYRFEQGLHESKISVAVVVQKMVESEVSGIAFSVHPVTEDRNQLIIEAGFGLGEAIVSGQITPDSYVVSKNPRRIMDINVNTQTRALHRVGESGGNEWRTISEPKASSQVLTESQILELSLIIVGIENHYGFPCDIEWAYEEGKFYIVQSRPITTLSNEEGVNIDKDVEKMTKKTQEISLADTCITSFGTKELFPPFHNSTLFVQTSGWNTQQYFGKHYADATLFPLLITVKDGEGIMYIPATKAKNLSEEVFRSYWNNSLSLDERLMEYEKQTEIIDRIYQEVIVSSLLATKSFEELVPYMQEMRSAVWEMNTLAFFSIYFDMEMCGKILSDIHSGINEKQLDTVWERGTIPTSDSFEKRRENLVLSLLDANETWEEIAIKCQYFTANYNNVVDLASVENEFKEKYAHLRDDEQRKKVMEEGDFLKNKKAHDHEEWCATRTLDEQKLIHYLQTIIDVRDSRKNYISKFLLVVFRISQKLFHDANVDEKLIYFYLLDEIVKGKDYLLENKKLLEKRLLGCSVFVDYDGAVRIEYGDFEKTKSKIGDFFLNQQNHLLNSKTIKGQSGSTGKVQGEVSVVMSFEKESHKFTEGSVLVTGMTRPEFVPLMKKSLAIVTDEGGITCHASIVSRELGIPCVVGTKIATQVLKDGDLVEVDADNGVVRVLERAEEVTQYVIPRRRPSLLTPVYWNPVLQTSEAVEKIYGTRMYLQYNFFVDGFVNAVIPQHEWDAAGDYIVTHILESPEYFTHIEKETQIARERLLAFLQSQKTVDLHALSFEDLVALSETIRDLFLVYDAASFFVWFVAGDPLHRRVAIKLSLSDEDLNTVMLPAELTYASQMERDVLFAACSDECAETAAVQLSKKYYWMPFGYDGPDMWDVQHFVKLINGYRLNLESARTELKRLQLQDAELRLSVRHIFERESFTVDARRLIQVLQTSAVWTDERKLLEYQLFFHYHQILDEFEVRYNVPMVLLKYLFTHELHTLKTDAEKMKNVAKKRMQSEFMTVCEDGVIRIASEDEMLNIKVQLGKQTKATEVQGSVACRGPHKTYQAYVRVLRSPQESSKVSDGDLLVASMTTPEYISVMKIALGFITDEGGVTCHAAIIAREMNKPCIIGTKIATQVLKDGDLVEVDANNGVVRVLERR